MYKHSTILYVKQIYFYYCHTITQYHFRGHKLLGQGGIVVNGSKKYLF